MLNVLVATALPLLLVFGLYHLFTWFNLLRINDRVPWQRVGLVSAIAHFLLATGFFVFSYYDYQANRDLIALGLNYGTYLFSRSDFWRLVTLYDTLPMVFILAFYAALDRMGIALPGIVAATIAITYILGTIQWYFLGGAAGALLQRFWEGLKTGDDEEDEWFR